MLSVKRCQNICIQIWSQKKAWQFAVCYICHVTMPLAAVVWLLKLWSGVVGLIWCDWCVIKLLRILLLVAGGSACCVESCPLNTSTFVYWLHIECSLIVPILRNNCHIGHAYNQYSGNTWNNYSGHIKNSGLSCVNISWCSFAIIMWSWPTCTYITCTVKRRKMKVCLYMYQYCVRMWLHTLC